MGGLCSGGALTPEEKEAQRMNKLIEKGLVKDRQRLREETKLLLLGTNTTKSNEKLLLPTINTTKSTQGSGESGKSTIFKQMKIISLMKGFTKEELENYKLAIIDNAVAQMKVLVEAANAKKRALESEKNLVSKRDYDNA